jgi:hypothetical protein
METRNFLGNLRVEMRAVGIPTALRRAGKAARCNGREGQAEKNAAAIEAIQKAESHDVSQSEPNFFDPFLARYAVAFFSGGATMATRS